MVNAKSDEEATSVVLATEAGSSQILRFLLKNGATVYGTCPRENLLDRVTTYTSKVHREETALEIVKFCNEKRDVDLLKKVLV